MKLRYIKEFKPNKTLKVKAIHIRKSSKLLKKDDRNFDFHKSKIEEININKINNLSRLK